MLFNLMSSLMFSKTMRPIENNNSYFWTDEVVLDEVGDLDTVVWHRSWLLGLEH